MEFKVQRPSTVWVETTVEADSLEDALEIADREFSNGDFEELYNTWEVDYDRYWARDQEETTYDSEVDGD